MPAARFEDVLHGRRAMDHAAWHAFAGDLRADARVVLRIHAPGRDAQRRPRGLRGRAVSRSDVPDARRQRNHRVAVWRSSDIPHAGPPGTTRPADTATEGGVIVRRRVW